MITQEKARLDGRNVGQADKRFTACKSDPQLSKTLNSAQAMGGVCQPEDIRAALQVIGLSRLSSGAKAVGVALIMSHNRKSGNCFPSVARIAKMTGRNRATVIRATNELAAKHYVFKELHAGPKGTDRYHINWHFLQSLIEEFELEFGLRKPVAEMRPLPSEQTRPVAKPRQASRRRNATQTHRNNPSKQHAANHHANDRIENHLSNRRLVSADEYAKICPKTYQRCVEAEVQRLGRGVELLKEHILEIRFGQV